jgi:hypothetical protein
MHKNLMKLIFPPTFDTDEKKRRAEFLHHGSSILFVFTLILFMINLSYGSPDAKDANWLLAIIALVQIIIKLMNRLGFVKAASIVLLTIGLLAMTLICLKVGGINDEAIFGYVLIIIASGYLLGWWFAFAYTMASIIAMWFLASLQMNGSIVPDIDGPYQTALDLTVVFVMILFVVYFLIKTLDKALKDAQSELSERKRIESEREELINQLSKEIAEKKRIEERREKLISELQAALSEVKTLRGIIPICANCKKVRDDEGYWQQVEKYIQDRSEAAFSHSICHECAKKLYPDIKLNGE